MNGFSAARDTFARLGPTNGLLYLVACALATASRGRCGLFKYHFVAQPVPRERLVGLPRTSSVRFRTVSSDDAVVSRFPRPPGVIAARFADGATCLVAEKDGELAAFIWLKLESYDEDEVRCRYVLAPDVAWDFDAWIAPRFRMGRMFVQLWDAANDLLRTHGRRWSASRISAFNPVSLASHARFGTVRLMSAVFVVLGPFQLSLLSRPPYLHCSVRNGQPTLAFHAPAPP